MTPSRETPGRSCMWGPFPSFQSLEEEINLEQYEMYHHMTESPSIELNDCKEILRQTFKWVRDKSLLKGGTLSVPFGRYSGHTQERHL